MGPLGVEGFFRIACELTLKVIREQKNTMLGVLKTFVHDPLVDWQGKGTVLPFSCEGRWGCLVRVGYRAKVGVY